MSYGVGHKCGLDLALLWCRPAAIAPVRPLAWEPPYAALKRQKNKKIFKNKKNKTNWGVSIVAQWFKKPINIHEDSGSIPDLDQRVKNLALLWLWCRQAAAARIRSLAWELPYVVGAALKKTKK